MSPILLHHRQSSLTEVFSSPGPTVSIPESDFCSFWFTSPATGEKNTKRMPKSDSFPVRTNKSWYDSHIASDLTQKPESQNSISTGLASPFRDCFSRVTPQREGRNGTGAMLIVQDCESRRRIPSVGQKITSSFVIFGDAHKCHPAPALSPIRNIEAVHRVMNQPLLSNSCSASPHSIEANLRKLERKRKEKRKISERNPRLKISPVSRGTPETQHSRGAMSQTQNLSDGDCEESNCSNEESLCSDELASAAAEYVHFRLRELMMPATNLDVMDKSTFVSMPPSLPTIQESELTDDDVVLGRGCGINNLTGNKQYRKLIQTQQSMYRKAHRKEKPQIARCMVEFIRSHIGGRFLKKDNKSELYYDVGDVKAETKTGQALREGFCGLIDKKNYKREIPNEDVTPRKKTRSP